jgi:hypothetical protein
VFDVGLAGGGIGSFRPGAVLVWLKGGGVMDCYSFLLGLGGLTVGIVTVVLSYRERRALLRQAVYEKQVQCCERVMELASKLEDAVAWELSAASSFPLSVEQRKVLDKATLDLSRTYSSVSFECSTWLPQEVLQKAADFWKVFCGICDDPNLADPKGSLRESFKALRDAVRISMGVDPISEEISGVMGIGKRRPQ